MIAPFGRATAITQVLALVDMFRAMHTSRVPAIVGLAGVVEKDVVPTSSVAIDKRFLIAHIDLWVCKRTREEGFCVRGMVPVLHLST